MSVVAKTKAEMMRKHGGRCLLGCVRDDQLEQTVLFQTGGLKRWAIKRAFRQRVSRSAARVDSIRTIKCFCNIKGCVRTFCSRQPT